MCASRPCVYFSVCFFSEFILAYYVVALLTDSVRYVLRDSYLVTLGLKGWLTFYFRGFDGFNTSIYVYCCLNSVALF